MGFFSNDTIVQPFVEAEPAIFHDNYVNTIVADTLAPCITFSLEKITIVKGFFIFSAWHHSGGSDGGTTGV